ncbi:phosphoenolpyruvate synthase [Candidatus Woesearchaeota archaeon]|nr:phosphoenolpyruvate synthase [Candidatus Woesearchaeota archaeon]
MDKKKAFILWFKELGIEDVPLVGGKNASLGEMYRNLTKKGVNIPNGFAVTAAAYRLFLKKARIEEKIKEILSDLDTHDLRNLTERGRKVRELILDSEFPEELEKEIREAYKRLSKEYNTPETDVAVRSSATAEDLPDASFAGQQETYLNVKGEHALIDDCKKCFASLFTNRAISYRVDKGFDHFKIALSIGIQKMVRSDLASSGVMFSIDTESGFKDAVLINAAYGLGENIVQGSVNPDQFYVFKPTLKKGFKPIISKKLGTKQIKMVYSHIGEKSATKNVDVSEAFRNKFCINDDGVLTLAKWAVIIEEHYSRKAGKFKPMDMEWAKDGRSNKLYIVQARPETVQSQKNVKILEKYELKEKGRLLVAGLSIGDKIGQGKAHIINSVRDIENFNKGDVLVTEMTDPDWEPIMKSAAAIVTNRGGKTCFTADTILLTNKGFMKFEDVFEDYEGLYVPSLNKKTLKVEWKRIIASMKRKNNAIEIGVSQTGRAKYNTLGLTPDHKILTFENRSLVAKEIRGVIKDNEMMSIVQKIPSLNESNEKDRKLAYLLGAISTDGNIYLTRRHGVVTFVQKPIAEKENFISTMQTYMKEVFHKTFSVSKKKESSGFIRGKKVTGNANAYRVYSKQVATELLEHKHNLVKTLLSADEELIFSFLAGVIDGDGTYSHKSSRINIFCSNKPLLQAIVVCCLRLGIVPQISRNRTIANIQIVERVNELLQHTKRVKGAYSRKTQGTRFFGAKQIIGDIIDKVNYKGRIRPYVDKNLLIDGDKIRDNILPLCPENLRENLARILESDLRMQRVDYSRDLGEQDVYNITVEDNHNYIVFTTRYTPILVNNCHAAIVARELGIPCVVGTGNGTEKIKNGQKITVSCAEGSDGFVYDGLLKFQVKKTDLSKLKKPKTKIMMNLGNPEQAFELSFIPNDGIGLARQEFIISSYIKVHPLALLHFDKIKNENTRNAILKATRGYHGKKLEFFFIDKLAEGVATLAAAFYPNDVIARLSDFKSNEYANLIGGEEFEPKEENPMLGWRGASRYYSEKYKEAFALECKALKKARDQMGLTNIKVMVPFCRTVEEAKKVIEEMDKHGLRQHKNGLELYVMCEIPSNVILGDEFSKIFDGFSIGTNDLTQLTLGLDRDSALVSHIYDENNPAVKILVADIIRVAKKNKKKVGICGDAPSSSQEFARFLVECGIDSMSLTPDAILKTIVAVSKEEKRLKRK